MNDLEVSLKLTITGETLSFVRDETLNMLLFKYENRILNALYQYTIMFSDSRKIYLKKKMLKEAYTHPFTFFFLKAVRATIEAKPIIGPNNWISEYVRCW